MPFVSRELLRLSLASLKSEYSPLLVVSLPCMTAHEIPTCQSGEEAQKRAIPFGSSEERAWLDEYFRPAGGPFGRPYYMPGTGEWVQSRYPGRALQRRRTDFDGSVFFHPEQERWALRPEAAKVLRSRVLKNGEPISLVALMAWMWRTREISDLPDALAGFIDDLKLNRDDLIGTVYTNQIPSEFETAGLSNTPLSQAEVSELIGASEPAPSVPDFATTVGRIEEALRKRDFMPIPGLVQRVLGGWLVGEIVVLVGPTGSGKTFLATTLSSAFESLIGSERFWSVFIEISSSYDSAQFIGYENLAGEFSAGQFVTEALLVGDISDPRLVILDEWNLAQIDGYFASVLSVVETGKPLTLPGRVSLAKLGLGEVTRAQPDIADRKCRVPEDTWFLATCNSWLEEPESRQPLSGPVKRRCRIIIMPNVLAVRLEQDGEAGLVEVSNALIRQETQAVARRRSDGRSSLWDAHRWSRLQEIATLDQLDARTRTKLLQIARVLLTNPETKNSLTPGLLRDILLSCIYALPGEQFSALGDAVACKILHQIQGERQILDALSGVTTDFPNTNEIADLIARLRSNTIGTRFRSIV